MPPARIITIIVGLAALATVTATAHAAPPGQTALAPAAAATDDVRVERYGAYTLGADLAAIGVALGTGSGELFLGTYLLGAPMIHMARGNEDKALRSLALRVTLPLVTTLAGAAIGDANCRGDAHLLCGVGEAAIGFLIGVVTASAIDAAVLAKTEHRESTPAALLRYRGIAAMPNVGVRRDGGLTAGLSGSF